MKKTDQAIEKSSEDLPCQDCVNKFRQCPMQIVLALSRVPQGMEVIVKTCPEKNPGEQ